MNCDADRIGVNRKWDGQVSSGPIYVFAQEGGYTLVAVGLAGLRPLMPTFTQFRGKLPKGSANVPCQGRAQVSVGVPE